MKKPRWLKVILWILPAVILAAGIAWYVSSRRSSQFRAEVLVKPMVRQHEGLLRSVAAAEESLQSAAPIFASEKAEYEDLQARAAAARESLPAISNRVQEVHALMKAGRYEQVRRELSLNYGLRKGETRDTLRKLITQRAGEADSVVSACRTLASLRYSALRNSQTIGARLCPLQGMTALLTNTGADLPEHLSEMVCNLKPGQLEHIRTNYPPALQNTLGATLFLHQELVQHIEKYLDPAVTNRPAPAFFDTAREAYLKVKPAMDIVPAECQLALENGKLTRLACSNLVAAQNQVLEQIRAGDAALNRLLRCYNEFEDQYYSVVVEQKRAPSEGDYECSLTIQTVTPAGAKTSEYPLGLHLARWNFGSPDLQTNYVREYKARHSFKLQRGPLELLQPQFLEERIEDLPMLDGPRRAGVPFSF